MKRAVGECQSSEPRLSLGPLAEVDSERGAELGDGCRLSRGCSFTTIDHLAHALGCFATHSYDGVIRFTQDAFGSGLRFVAHARCNILHALLDVVAASGGLLGGNHAEADGDIRSVARNFGGRSHGLAHIDGGKRHLAGVKLAHVELGEIE